MVNLAYELVERRPAKSKFDVAGERGEPLGIEARGFAEAFPNAELTFVQFVDAPKPWAIRQSSEVWANRAVAPQHDSSRSAKSRPVSTHLGEQASWRGSKDIDTNRGGRVACAPLHLYVFGPVASHLPYVIEDSAVVSLNRRGNRICARPQELEEVQRRYVVLVLEATDKQTDSLQP